MSAGHAGLPRGRRPSRAQPEPPAEGVPAPAGVVAPDRLEALGYLAPDTSVVAAVHVRELLADVLTGPRRGRPCVAL